MRFWDTSALVQLLAPQAHTPRVQQLLRADAEIVVWMWTPVECLSALTRLEREGTMIGASLWRARARLDELRAAWSEIQDARAVRARAERCLLLHPLRAADAGQLAAALLLSERLSQNVSLVTFDARLAEAARREGLDAVAE
jgi:predicted nucleic acid-binding protein